MQIFLNEIYTYKMCLSSAIQCNSKIFVFLRKINFWSKYVFVRIQRNEFNLNDM